MWLMLFKTHYLIYFSYPYYDTTRVWIICPDIKDHIQDSVSSILLSESNALNTNPCYRTKIISYILFLGAHY